MRALDMLSVRLAAFIPGAIPRTGAAAPAIPIRTPEDGARIAMAWSMASEAEQTAS
jgi:hypothetical protein